ncbi:MAG: hydrogen gas-evolving membrane-bound hydrogenase subunit E [Bacteroidales bacterium]
MVRYIIVLLLLIGFGAMLYPLVVEFQSPEKLPEVASVYARQGPGEVGAANLVTAVVVTYRGLDTLGEVTILFLSAAIVAFMLKMAQENKQSRTFHPVSEILQTGSKVLTPAVFLLGVYVFIHGHLTPGGGFQGGAILASGFVLMLLAKPDLRWNKNLIHTVESISGFAFVFIGILGIIYAGGFLDNSLLALGTFGTVLSAGAIPLIYLFIGLKVGAELASIVGNLQESQNQTV